MANDNKLGILDIMILTYLNPDRYKRILKQSGEILKNERLAEPNPERKDIREVIPEEVIDILRSDKRSEEERRKIKEYIEKKKKEVITNG